MNTSPYFTGSAPNFGPPSGMASLIAQGRELRGVDNSGLQQLADVAERFKREQDMGKAADFFAKANPDALSQMGIHEEQWKTLGSRDKAAAVTGFMKAEAAKSMMQELADAAQRSRANAAFGEAFGRAQGNVLSETLAAGGGPRIPRTLTLDDFARAASDLPDAWTAPGAAPLLRQFADRGTEMAGAPESTTMGGADVIFNRRTGAFQISPFSKAEAAAANRKEADGMIEIPDPQQPVFGPRIRIPLSVAKRDYPDLVKRLTTQQPAAPQEAPNDPKERTKGTVYKTPKGELEWTGTGWKTPTPVK